MNLTIRTSGGAGMGVNSTALILAGIVADMGYSLLSDVEYESRIKGGNNNFDLFITDTTTPHLSNQVDILISFDNLGVDKNFKNLKENSIIIINEKYKEKIKSDLNSKNINLLTLHIDDKYDNTYLLGVLIKLLNLDLTLVKKHIEEVFGKKGEETVKNNIDIIENIYSNYDININFENKLNKVGSPKKISYGNKLIADGATASDLEYYSAYPMTPASTILTEIIEANQVTYLQAEDEIAVINSALGASYTGKRAMVGTSGGGFALMTEALSFAVQAEFPITVVLSQRAGPSTGTPTFHEAGDLNFALNPTFGDFNHVVVIPSTLEECYSFGGLALNIADMFQTQVILLIDKQLSEMHGSIESLIATKVNRGKILNNPSEDYKRYELTEDDISPRVIVGTPNGDFIATSYEHDEYGATTENPDMKIKMTEKRFKKLENFYDNIDNTGYEIINPEAKNMLLTTSFISYTAKKFIQDNPDYGLCIIKIIKPLNKEILKYLENKEKIVFLESNYSGQLENYITKELGLKGNIKHIRKYDLYPFYIEDLEKIKNL